MIWRNNIIKFWSIFAIVLVLALLAITVAFKWHRIFPDDRVSLLYTKASKVEGLSASFVEGYRVNDTLSLDVTLLETQDRDVQEFLTQLRRKKMRKRIIWVVVVCLLLLLAELVQRFLR